jgi:hypothetical protein
MRIVEQHPMRADQVVSETPSAAFMSRDLQRRQGETNQICASSALTIPCALLRHRLRSIDYGRASPCRPNTDS